MKTYPCSSVPTPATLKRGELDGPAAKEGVYRSETGTLYAIVVGEGNYRAVLYYRKNVADSAAELQRLSDMNSDRWTFLPNATLCLEIKEPK